jgi:hypothetical protein
MEAADDDPVAVGVEEGQGEALVATGLLEGVVANQADLLERRPASGRDAGRPGADVLDVARDPVHPIQVDPEDALEAVARFAPRQALDPPAQAPDPATLHQRQQEQHEDRHAEAHHDGPEVRRDDGVQVDGRLLRAGPARV